MTEENECILCGIISGKIPSKKIYEDDNAIVILDINGASPGHAFVIPKEHYPIIEQIPDPMVGILFDLANKTSSAIFETLNIQGTNIFVTNGVAAGQKVAHFMINVVPRNENDGINMDWQPKQLSDEEMSTVELKLKDAAQNIGGFESPTASQPKKQTEQKVVTLDNDEDNYLIKQLNRIP